MQLGPAEIIGIVVLALLLFGSRKLPELGSSIGQTITNFKNGMAEAKEEEEVTDDVHQAAITPTTPPVQTTAVDAERIDNNN